MAKGKVTEWNDSKGFGFITKEGEAKTVFVHYTAIQQEGLKTLKEGQLVEFDEVHTTSPSGPQAQNVKVSTKG